MLPHVVSAGVFQKDPYTLLVGNFGGYAVGDISLLVNSPLRENLSDWSLSSLYGIVEEPCPLQFTLSNGGDGPYSDTTPYRGKYLQYNSDNFTIKHICIYAKEKLGSSLTFGLKDSLNPGSPEKYRFNINPNMYLSWTCVDVNIPWKSKDIFIYKISNYGEVGWDSCPNVQCDSIASDDGGSNWYYDGGVRRGYRLNVAINSPCISKELSEPIFEDTNLPNLPSPGGVKLIHIAPGNTIPGTYVNNVSYIKISSNYQISAASDAFAIIYV